MKKDNKMMAILALLSILSLFVFSQEGDAKLTVWGFCLLAAVAAGYNGYLILKKKSWPGRRFALLCSGMGLFTAALVMLAGKLKFQTEKHGGLVIWEGVVAFLIVFGWCAFCVWTEKGVTENVVLLILFGGFLIRIFYVVLTQAHIYQNDLGALIPGDYGHMGYVYYLYSQGRLPDVNPMEFYQFYQPPLHYAVCALLLKVFQVFGCDLSEAQELLQVPAALWGTLTLFFINKIGVRLRIPPLGRGIALGVASFLPLSILLGGALNNDGLMTLLVVMALYYTLVWYEYPGTGKIAVMAVCIGCAMMTKLSGVLAAPAMAALMLQKAWKDRIRWKVYLKQFLCFGVIAFPLGLWYSLLRFWQFGMPLGFVPRLAEDAEQFIGMHMTWDRLFDFKNAFQSLSLGWVNTERADYNIPVSMVKYAVFGEGDFYRINPVLTAVGTGLFWIVLVLGILTGAALVIWFFQKRNTVMEKVFLGLVIAVSLYSYFRFCLDYPFVCTMNIRYIIGTVYLAFLVLGAVAAQAVDRVRQKSPATSRAICTVLVGGVGIYIAGAVTMIVQLDQLIP